MIYWKQPPRIKIYEALGAIADDRVHINDFTIIVDSSDRSKIYTVKYNPENNAVTSNDNGSHWQKYLGYPSIAVLMLNGKISFDKQSSEALKGIPWKDWNDAYKNDYAKTEATALKYVGAYAEHVKKTIQDIETFLQTHLFPVFTSSSGQ